MHIITRKITLLPAPFTGTRIRIRIDDPASLTWGIHYLALSTDHTTAVIDWGDLSSSEVTTFGSVTHAYARTGEYEVRISDDLESLRCSTTSATSPFRSVYAPMIREFRTNATLLETLEDNCFRGATNLSAFRCEGSRLCTLEVRTFGQCASLNGRLDFANADYIATNTFDGCPGIAELHFGKANEETIKSLSSWEASGGKFGAANAIIRFDL